MLFSPISRVGCLEFRTARYVRSCEPSHKTCRLWEHGYSRSVVNLYENQGVHKKLNFWLTCRKPDPYYCTKLRCLQHLQKQRCVQHVPVLRSKPLHRSTTKYTKYHTTVIQRSTQNVTLRNDLCEAVRAKCKLKKHFISEIQYWTQRHIQGRHIQGRHTQGRHTQGAYQHY